MRHDTLRLGAFFYATGHHIAGWRHPSSEADGGLHVTGVAFGTTTGAPGTVLAGDYGAITIAADGRYHYDLDPADPAVVALGANETLTETFHYTVQDADGDSATATTSATGKPTASTAANGRCPAPGS